MKGPIFIVGTMRSGSTLLRLILDSHERISIGPESGFMGAVRAMKAIPDWKPGPGWYERFGISEDDMNARIRRFFNDIFASYASTQGKARWGDKTPFHTWHVEEMAKIFPDAAFIGIVRHPAATGVSLRRWDYSFEEALSKWARANAELVRQACNLGPRRVALCRYEDLVLYPEPTLRGLMDFLSEPWSDALLKHHEVQEARETPGVADGGARTRDPIDVQRVRRWREDISEAELAMIASRTPNELLRVLGYRPGEAMPLPVGEGAAGTPAGLVPVDDVDLRRLPRGKYAAGAFAPTRRVTTTDPAELAHLLEKAERTLDCYRVRPSVKLWRKLQRARHTEFAIQVRRAARNVRQAWLRSGSQVGG